MSFLTCDSSKKEWAKRYAIILRPFQGHYQTKINDKVCLSILFYLNHKLRVTFFRICFINFLSLLKKQLILKSITLVLAIHQRIEWLKDISLPLQLFTRIKMEIIIWASFGNMALISKKSLNNLNPIFSSNTDLFEKLYFKIKSVV